MTMQDIKYLSNEAADAIVSVYFIREQEQTIAAATAANADNKSVAKIFGDIQACRSGIAEDKETVLVESAIAEMHNRHGVPSNNISDASLDAMGITAGKPDMQG